MKLKGQWKILHDMKIKHAKEERIARNIAIRISEEKGPGRYGKI
jgi:hypothetical protein